MLELAIYFTNGNVAYFKDVQNFQEYLYDEEDESQGTWIEFEYFGVTSERWRKAKFENYAGYSLTIENQIY